MICQQKAIFCILTSEMFFIFEIFFVVNRQTKFHVSESWVCEAHTKYWIFELTLSVYHRKYFKIKQFFSDVKVQKNSFLLIYWTCLKYFRALFKKRGKQNLQNWPKIVTWAHFWISPLYFFKWFAFCAGKNIPVCFSSLLFANYFSKCR